MKKTLKNRKSRDRQSKRKVKSASGLGDYLLQAIYPADICERISSLHQRQPVNFWSWLLQAAETASNTHNAGRFSPMVSSAGCVGDYLSTAECVSLAQSLYVLIFDGDADIYNRMVALKRHMGFMDNDHAFITTLLDMVKGHCETSRPIKKEVDTDNQLQQDEDYQDNDCQDEDWQPNGDENGDWQPNGNKDEDWQPDNDEDPHSDDTNEDNETDDKGDEEYSRYSRPNYTYKGRGPYLKRVRKEKAVKKKQFRVKATSVVCDLCGKVYCGGKEGLRAHYKRAHNPDRKKDFQCSECELSFYKRDSLESHVRVKHECKRGEYMCHLCGRTFVTKSYMKLHEATHEGADKRPRYPCDKCTKVFLHRSTYRLHMATTHERSVEYRCDVCGKLSASSSALASHMQTHGDKQYVCEDCGKGFNAPRSLKRHVMTIHRNMGRYACSHCYKSFGAQKSLDAHIRVHTGEAPYVCTMCGASFKQTSGLYGHMRKRHQQVEPPPATDGEDQTSTAPASGAVASKCEVQYICSVVTCQCVFQQKNGLTRHMLKAHPDMCTDDFPFVCEVCFTRFKYKTALSHHMRKTHPDATARAGVPEYPCSMCPDKFTNANGLSIHTSRVHSHAMSSELMGRKLAECAYCPMKFTRRRSLMQHVNKKHQDECVAKEIEHAVQNEMGVGMCT